MGLPRTQEEKLLRGRLGGPRAGAFEDSISRTTTSVSQARTGGVSRDSDVWQRVVCLRVF